MTDPLFQKLNTAAQDIRLESGERDAMREVLFTHMRQRPLAVAYLTPSPYRFFTMRRVMALVLVPVVLIALTGGTAYAAQGALPGDVLYPIKIAVNEQVESALATTPTQKALLNVELAQRRLEEAQALAEQGKLNATTTAQLQSNLNAHAQQAQELVQSVAKSDPSQAAEISTELVSSLAANDAVLQDLADHSKDAAVRRYTQELSRAVLSHIDSGVSVALTYAGAATSSAPASAMTLAFSSSTATSSGHASSTRVSEPRGPSAAIALRLGQRATTELSSATTRFADQRSTLDATTSTSIAEQLSAQEQLLEAGNAALAAGDTTQALSDFTQAYAAAIRIETILKAGQRLGSSLLNSMFSVLQAPGQTPSATSTPTSTPDYQHASSSASMHIDSAASTSNGSEQLDTSHENASERPHARRGWFPLKLTF